VQVAVELNVHVGLARGSQVAIRRLPMRHLLPAALIAVVACGSSEPATEEAAAESSGQEAQREEAPDELAVTGLKGTLSQDEVQNALEPRMPKFARCVQKRAGAVEWLSGSIELSFRVAVDGAVAAVFPTRSSMGDRETERCALDVARATRFPQPHGGEAEFSWSFEVPLDGEIRPPVDWGADAAGVFLSEQASQVTANCGAGSYAITAYVDTEGKVVSAGAAAGSEAEAEQLDCVLDVVRAFTFESPGSYAAKLQFAIQ
jgi:hypothetical protein